MVGESNVEKRERERERMGANESGERKKQEKHERTNERELHAGRPFLSLVFHSLSPRAGGRLYMNVIRLPR